MFDGESGERGVEDQVAAYLVGGDELAEDAQVAIYWALVGVVR